MCNVPLHLTALDISSTEEYNSYRPALHHWSFAPVVVAPEEHVIRLEMELEQILSELEAEILSIRAKEERNLKLAAENIRLEKLLAQVKHKKPHLAAQGHPE